MKILMILFTFWSVVIFADESAKHPKLFLTKGKIIYDEECNGKKQPEFITLNSNSSTYMKDGAVVVVNNSDNERARPVYRIKDVPNEFILHLKIKLEGNGYKPSNPWLDIGGNHRNHFRFTGESTLFNSEDKDLSKRKITNSRPGNLVPLNEWLFVTVELIKGKLGISINGKTEIYEEEQIEIGSKPAISMKALRKGKVHIDYIKVWEAK